MATDEAKDLVDWTMHVIDRLSDISRLLKRPLARRVLLKRLERRIKDRAPTQGEVMQMEKLTNAISAREMEKIEELLSTLEQTIRVNFGKYPPYMRALQRKLNEVWDALESDNDPVKAVEDALENAVNNIVSWMIDYVVRIERGQVTPGEPQDLNTQTTLQ